MNFSRAIRAARFLALIALPAACCLSCRPGDRSDESGVAVGGMIQSARDYCAADHFAEASDLFARALAADPGSVPAQLGIGDCERAAGRPAAAEKYYERALAHGLPSGEDYLRLAAFSRENGKFDRAAALVAESFRPAIDLDSANVGAYINLKYCSENGFPSRPVSPAVPGEGVIRVTDRRRDRIAAEDDSLCPSSLVFFEFWFFPWRAEMDGRPSPLESVCHILMGTPLSAGRHSVRFYFDSHHWLLILPPIISSIMDFSLAVYSLLGLCRSAWLSE
jgi:hypothetical protein